MRKMMIYKDDIEKEIATKVVKKYEKASKEEFQEIVKKYKSEVPLYKKAVNFLVNSCSEEYITYLLARDTLSGKFSYEKFNKWCAEEINREKEAHEHNERITLEIRARDENIAKGKKVELFPGSLSEYEQFKGKKYEIIELSPIEPFYFSHNEVECEALGKIGAVALIRFQYAHNTYGHGLPVKEKK